MNAPIVLLVVATAFAARDSLAYHQPVLIDPDHILERSDAFVSQPYEKAVRPGDVVTRKSVVLEWWGEWFSRTYCNFIALGTEGIQEATYSFGQYEPVIPECVEFAKNSPPNVVPALTPEAYAAFRGNEFRRSKGIGYHEGQYFGWVKEIRLSGARELIVAIPDGKQIPALEITVTIHVDPNQQTYKDQTFIEAFGKGVPLPAQFLYSDRPENPPEYRRQHWVESIGSF
jgi:hypothetical protein